MRIRLTRKLAEAVDGIDLSLHHVGDWIDVSEHDADMLIAEGWALPTDGECRRVRSGLPSDAADRPSRPKLKRPT
jgi:hypothetical protein